MHLLLLSFIAFSYQRQEQLSSPTEEKLFYYQLTDEQLREMLQTPNLFSSRQTDGAHATSPLPHCHAAASKLPHYNAAASPLPPPHAVAPYDTELSPKVVSNFDEAKKRHGRSVKTQRSSPSHAGPHVKVTAPTTISVTTSRSKWSPSPQSQTFKQRKLLRPVNGP